MKIELEELKEGVTEFNFESVDGKELSFPKNFRTQINFCKAYGKINKRGKEYYLSIGVSANAEFQCARCLTPFIKELKEKSYYRITLSKDRLLEKKKAEISEEDISTLYIMEPLLDLLPLVREILILSLPMKPLCKESCKGLCPKCGKNLNYEKCNCEIEVNTALSKLKKLLK